jgi:hypothetical protein
VELIPAKFTYPSNQMMAKGEDLRLKGGNEPVEKVSFLKSTPCAGSKI